MKVRANNASFVTFVFSSSSHATHKASFRLTLQKMSYGYGE